MLASNISRNLCRSRIRQFGGSIAHLSSGFARSNATHRQHDDVSNLRISGKTNFPLCRHYSGETGVRLPPLCDHPVALWPAIFKTIRNSFFVNMVIRPQYDPEFNITDFITASKQALLVVGNALAREDWDILDGLVTNDCLQSLKQKLSTLSAAQKQLIAVQKEDVYMSFPYEVGIIQEGDKDRERTFVEITVVHHMMRGLAQMKERGEALPLNMGMVPEYQERLFVANYRFIREYTKGVDSPWIVNMVNHFMPITLE